MRSRAQPLAVTNQPANPKNRRSSDPISRNEIHHPIEAKPGPGVVDQGQAVVCATILIGHRHPTNPDAILPARGYPHQQHVGACEGKRTHYLLHGEYAVVFP